MRALGLSEVSADTLRKACSVHPIAAVQSEYSLWTREPEIAVLDALRRLELDRNTIVVLWGDHGWHLGEKAITGKNTLWDRSTRGPLIFAGPGAGKGVICSQPAELLDAHDGASIADPAVPARPAGTPPAQGGSEARRRAEASSG